MLLTYANLYQLLVAFHLIGLTLGLGGASISDFTFLGELRKQGRVAPETVSRMKSFSQMVWIGLTILSLSGLGLILLDHGQDLYLPGFQAKMVVVAILVLNGLWLNFYATPKLAKLSFSESYALKSAAWRERKLIFIFGAISVTSWYGAFFIAMFKQLVVLPFLGYLAVYGIVLAGAIAMALRMERKLSQHPPVYIAPPPDVAPQAPAVPTPNPAIAVPTPALASNAPPTSPVIAPPAAANPTPAPPGPAQPNNQSPVYPPAGPERSNDPQVPSEDVPSGAPPADKNGPAGTTY